MSVILTDKYIFQKFEEILTELTWVKLVTWKKIRLSASEFRDQEIPLIQIYGPRQSHLHSQRRLETTMMVHVELVMKNKVTGLVDVEECMDRRQEIEQKIGENVQLRLIHSGMVHVKYVLSEDDFHTIQPYYVTRLDFEVLYYKPYVGAC